MRRQQWQCDKMTEREIKETEDAIADCCNKISAFEIGYELGAQQANKMF